jgi:hypothetical protein
VRVPCRCRNAPCRVTRSRTQSTRRHTLERTSEPSRPPSIGRQSRAGYASYWQAITHGAACEVIAPHGFRERRRRLQRTRNQFIRAHRWRCRRRQEIRRRRFSHPDLTVRFPRGLAAPSVLIERETDPTSVRVRGQLIRKGLRRYAPRGGQKVCVDNSLEMLACWVDRTGLRCAPPRFT